MKFFKGIFILLIISALTACGISAKPADKLEPLQLVMTPIVDMFQLEPEVPIEPLTDLDLQAKSVILINAENGELLYHKNNEQPLPVASMSKIMSELLVLQAIDSGELAWDDQVTISDYAYTISNHPGFASVKLKRESSYTVEELFQAMAIHSANGATIALAEAVSGSEQNFVKQMNNTAHVLGLKQTAFVNSTGLTNSDLGKYYSTGDSEDTNMMSANDLAVLAAYVIDEYPELLDTSRLKEFDFQDETFGNSNWMLPGSNIDYLKDINTEVTFDGIDGLKTGYTEIAGYCFTGTAVIDDRRFISVVMGTENLEDRFLETKILFEEIADQLNH